MRAQTPVAAPAPEPPRADINVTPLVDVCLVLLIIFMVVTPMIRDGVEVAVPESVKPESIPERAGQIVVSVTRDGTLWVNDARVPPEALPGALRALGVTARDHEVLVRGDRSLPYGRVRAVFKLLNDAGVARAALVTLNDDRSGGS